MEAFCAGFAKLWRIVTLRQEDIWGDGNLVKHDSKEFVDVFFKKSAGPGFDEFTSFVEWHFAVD